MVSTATALLIFIPAISSAGLDGTAHDFSVNFKGFSSNTKCDTCHTPHVAEAQAPMWGWNHTVTKATFTMYTSPKLDSMPAPAQPTDYSLVCLSCHDGTVAVDSYALNAGDIYITRTDGSSFLNVDLTDDHPISIPYPSTDLDLHTTVTLPLPDGRVECATCHDPHSDEHPNFLRMSNAGSRLCLTCHIK